MAPGEEPFEPGSLVRFVDLPGELNGATGKLLRSLGRGRWAVAQNGKDRSTVVNEKNLERYVEPAAGPAPKVRLSKPTPYHIVGTWDDWEPHEMEWNAGLSCFEFVVRLGNDGVESFKFIVGGEWEACVYPDMVGASCHTRHNICGPDDGGVDSEWTIGLHQDLAEPGTSYKVRVFLAADDQPLKVDWLREPPDQPSKANKVSDDFVEYNEHVQAPAVKHHDPSPPKEDWDYVNEQFDVEAVERAARLRLERRLREAAEAEMQAITDGDEGTSQWVAEQEQAKLEAKIAENKKRYVAHCGTRQERAQQALTTIPPEVAAKLERPPPPDVVQIERLKGKCMECSVMTEVVVDVGGYCCQTCFKMFQDVCKDGWNGSTLIQGKQAAQHAQRLVDQKRPGSTLTIGMARRQVMNQFPQFFKKNTADQVTSPYQVSARQ